MAEASVTIAVVDAHLRPFVAGHTIVELQWTLGPVPDAAPNFPRLH